jgi:hypothetical protein
MPLFRDREQFEFQRSDGIYFWMKDGADQVLCKVSQKALRVRNGLDGGDADLAATFVRHRVRVEMVAGKKYDEGHRRQGCTSKFFLDAVSMKRSIKGAIITGE